MPHRHMFTASVDEEEIKHIHSIGFDKLKSELHVV